MIVKKFSKAVVKMLDFWKLTPRHYDKILFRITRIYERVGPYNTVSNVRFLPSPQIIKLPAFGRSDLKPNRLDDQFKVDYYCSVSPSRWLNSISDINSKPDTRCADVNSNEVSSIESIRYIDNPKNYDHSNIPIYLLAMSTGMLAITIDNTKFNSQVLKATLIMLSGTLSGCCFGNLVLNEVKNNRSKTNGF